MLGALSLILNGGGVAQLKTIAQELNKAVTGREDNVRSVLSQIDTFTGSLDTNKAQIVDAIEALNRLALSAHQQEGNIDEALEELPSALTSIDGQRQDLVRMLQALDQLSGRRGAGDQGVEGRDHRLAAPAPAGAQPAGRLRRQLRQGVQRLPDLPVRRRGRRPRPAGRAQPAHGRLHQPVDHPRGRPDPGAADRPDRRAADPARPGPAAPERARLHRQRQPRQRGLPEGAQHARGAAQAQGALPGAGQQEQDRVRRAQHRPGPARAAGGRHQPGPAEPARRCARRCARRAGPQRHRAVERRGTRWADHGPAADGLRPVAGQPAGAHLVEPGTDPPTEGRPSDHPPYQDPADGLRR